MTLPHLGHEVSGFGTAPNLISDPHAGGIYAQGAFTSEFTAVSHIPEQVARQSTPTLELDPSYDVKMAKIRQLEDAGTEAALYIASTMRKNLGVRPFAD